ncbi:uncharacterized protein LOC111633398 [Centruroides sculpturatus]|uniref:uncharacterized protein LOC111633398 n=1 Tax=Centruroides sculpturatus TaxID=218467 RepID=UPI000C6DB07A|nr:uncharacterized protein LOC111633398 [Centruroides sculpturatus]
MTKIHKETKAGWTEENKLKDKQLPKGSRQTGEKDKKSKMKLLKKREYQRLRSMVPSIATNPHVSKVTVIEEAIRYIDHLHSALIVKLRNRGLPQCLQGSSIDVNQLGQSEIRELIRHLVVNPTMPVPQRWMRERNRHIPSYHLTRHRKLL